MKLNKKIFSAILASGILVTSAAAAEMTPIDAAKNAFCIKADGTYLSSENYVYNNAVYVPLRDVCEALGAEVLWDNDTRTITVTSGKEKSDKYNGEYFSQAAENLAQLPAYFDSVKIIIDGKETAGTSFILNDKTYVSADVIAQASSHIYLDRTTTSLRVYSDSYNTDDSFASYGDKKLTKEEFMEIVSFVYQGDITAPMSDGFAALDNYLLFNDAIVSVAKDAGIDMSEETLNEFYKEYPIEKVSPVEALENTDSVKENILNYYYAYKNLSEKMGTLYTPTDEELNEIYKTYPYANKLTLKAQHILISKDEAGEGLKKIESLLKEARKEGTDFTELMIANSEDPGSQSQPEGYIFSEGEMVDEFYEAALNTPVGEISDVFESTYGYHIVKKIAHWENGVPMEEIKDQLISVYSSIEVDEKLIEAIKNSDACYDTQAVTNEVVKIILEQQAVSEADKS